MCCADIAWTRCVWPAVLCGDVVEQKYLTADNRSRIARFCNAFGERWAHPLFMVLHLALFVLSGALAALVFWRYYVAHTVFLVSDSTAHCSAVIPVN
jgi:hypothetical protein